MEGYDYGYRTAGDKVPLILLQEAGSLHEVETSEDEYGYSADRCILVLQMLIISRLPLPDLPI